MTESFSPYDIARGLLAGYLLVSVFESLCHRFIGHAAPWQRKLWRRMGKFGEPFLRSWYCHHVVHHCRTYRQDYMTQFSCPEEEEKLRRHVIAQGYGTIIGQSYGVRVGGPRDFVRFVAPTLPAFSLMCWIGGAWFTLGALFPLFLMPLASQFVHPYIHMPYSRAILEAPAAVRGQKPRAMR